MKSKGVWSFVDLFLLLCVVLFVSTQMKDRESSAESKIVPPRIDVFLDINIKGECFAKCNGKRVNPRGLAKIAQMGLAKTGRLNVAAHIDKNVPFGFIDTYEKAVSGTIFKRKSVELKPNWTQDLLR